MYITGFSESIAELLTLQSEWVVRGISVSVLLALLGINLAGVKWIVRLQLLLLAVLAVSTLDFVIGTFTHLDPGVCVCVCVCVCAWACVCAYVNMSVHVGGCLDRKSTRLNSSH